MGSLLKKMDEAREKYLQGLQWSRYSKRKLLLTSGSDRTKKRIMKISGVECAIAWCENTDLYILNRLDVQYLECDHEGGCKAY